MPIDRAIQIAESYDLDLVEVAPDAKPPVCKVIDFGKFMYEKKKKEKEAKKKQHTVQVKELRFRPNTDDHDLEFKTRHAREFLEGGDKVKATVQFRGREACHVRIRLSCAIGRACAFKRFRGVGGRAGERRKRDKDETRPR